MGDLSAHFSRHEFDSHDGAISHPDGELIARLEELRRRCHDRPLRIVSGYRSPAQNRRVHGAPHSQHLVNRAADIPAGYARLADAEAAGFSGIGHCGGWVVHVDVRPGPRAVFEDC